MNKKLLSIAIIIAAAAIIVVNVWNHFNKKETEDVIADSTLSENEDVPGFHFSSEVSQGNKAPDFQLMTLDGETVKLSDYEGKKVLVNFWATWCPPCKAEMPHMQHFYEKNKDNDIEILAVNLTKIDHGRKKIESFVEEYGLTFPVLLDEDNAIGTQYQAFTMPTSYFIDSNGVISAKVVGPMDESMMEELMGEMN